jgi:hypothetical protein
MEKGLCATNGGLISFNDTATEFLINLSSHVNKFVMTWQKVSLCDIRYAQIVSNIIEAFSIAC